MGIIKKKRCKHCRMLFPPDPRNGNRQKFCREPDCRKASKKDSQHRWLKKPENRDYFRCPENVTRVQQWRKANPGYWKKTQDALQEPLSGQDTVNIDDTNELGSIALQDLLKPQPFVLIGLIANITGLALQDDIAKTVRHLQQLGQDIINPATPTKGGRNDIKNPYFEKSHPKSSQTVQLGRSPTGP
ncbi:MAG: hypothetical protein JRF47_14995 [Deltaproteobacteria bacterium]|nr:hypothetical protein [Deltaproteobacteria bacterium]